MRAVLLVMLAGCESLLGLTPIPPPDGAGPSPVFVQSAFWMDGTLGAQQIVLPVTLSKHATLCIVTVGLAGYGPTVTSVSYAGTPLTELVSIRGVTDTPDTDTFTTQWWLAAPELGSGYVIVTMGQAGTSSQVNAMFFDGADQVQPFGAMQATSGNADHSEITVATSPDDLVESVTGQGAGISGVGQLSTEVFEHNVDNTTALDNAAGSVTPSAGPTTTIAWQYTGVDEFQTVAASIVPAAP
jgi:hypothetical protein